MKSYQTKSENIEAVQYFYPATPEIKTWLGRCFYTEIAERRMNGIRELRITNLNENETFDIMQSVFHGDWIIKRGRKFYPMQNATFLEKYEEANSTECLSELSDFTKNAIDKEEPRFNEILNKAMDALEQIGDPVGHATKNLQQGQRLNGRYLADLVVQLMPVRGVALDALEELKRL